jgi:uncharacterized protein (DUF1015 family)
MAVLRPFRPWRYNPATITDLASVVAPPYDVIDAAQRDRLYARAPHNVVRLILNRSADPYADAAATLRAWRQEGVLIRDPHPALAYHVERFRLPDGAQRERSGVIAAVRLESFAGGAIRPHERTFARAKEDRLRLIRACRMNLSPIFGLYAKRPAALDAARATAERRPPDMALTDDMGVEHRMWLLAEPPVIAAVTQALAAETIYIADGHHRYETALAYRDSLIAEGARDAAASHNFVMMYLTSTSDPGLVILPTHRVLAGAVRLQPSELIDRLRQVFRIEALARTERARFWTRLRGVPHGRFGIALAGHENLLVATLEDVRALDRYVADLAPSVRHLDVSILDRAVLRGILGVDCTAAAQEGRLVYTHDDAAALDAVSQGAAAAFLMNVPRIADVLQVCGSGDTMPEKSTYFFPKLLTGLVFHCLEE